jgi:IS605 OrfB family transposase
MQVLSLQTRLEFSSESDKTAVLEFLQWEQFAFNFVSNIHFGAKKNSVVELHAKCYKKFRGLYPQIKCAVIGYAIQNCLACYRACKTQKITLNQPISKKNLGTRLCCKGFSFKNNVCSIVNLGKRVKCKPYLYDKLSFYLQKYKFGDITIFVKDNDIWISFPFKIPINLDNVGGLSLGVDIGIRRPAATSDGKIFIDRKFNKEKRKLRYLKRCLKRSNTRTAKKHLYKIKYKERNKNKNFNHHLSKKILDNKSSIIVLENLDVKKMKLKKNRYQNKNRISQVCFSQLRDFITYKAALLGKRVVCVSPYYTSQIDSVTNKKEGIRKGCRFLSKNGAVYDADVNASVNIARRFKHPISCGNILDGQVVVVQPIV